MLLNLNTLNYLATHLPILQVLIPLFSSIAIAFTNKTNSALFISRSCSLLGSILGAYGIFVMTKLPSPYFYTLGNWPSAIGIEYRMDNLNQLMIFVINSILFLLFLFNDKLIKTKITSALTPKKAHLFFTILLLVHTGFCGVLLSNDLFNIYVFIEITSLASYTLIVQGFEKKALLGSINYLITGTIGATLILISSGLILVSIGSLNISHITLQIKATHSKLLDTSIIFYIVGCLLKVALFPMHSWLVSAYKYTSSVILSYFSAVSGLVGFYILIFFINHIITDSYLVQIKPLVNALALFSTIFFAYYAIIQSNLKALMAYSIVSEVGYITLMIFTADSVESQTQGVILVLTSSLVKAAIYSSIAQIETSYDDCALKKIQGIGLKYKTFGVLLVLNLICNLGLPPTIGFINKLQVFKSVFKNLGYLAIFGLALGTALKFIYNYKIVDSIYKFPKDSTAELWLANESTHQMDTNKLAFDNHKNYYVITLTIVNYLIISFYNPLSKYLEKFFLNQ